jgi:copper homeostasis protein
VTRSPLEALEDIISIGGIQRILTSGQDSSALEGLDTLVKVFDAAKGRIGILPGGGM